VHRHPSKLEDARAFQEEGSLLGEKRLDGRQVDDCRIYLDLTEVRVHRAT
jgi:hypothetical protein